MSTNLFSHIVPAHPWPRAGPLSCRAPAVPSTDLRLLCSPRAAPAPSLSTPGHASACPGCRINPSQAPAQIMHSIRGWFTAIKFLSSATVAAQCGTHQTLAPPSPARMGTLNPPRHKSPYPNNYLLPAQDFPSLRSVCPQVPAKGGWTWERYHRGCCNLGTEVSEQLRTSCPLKLSQSSDSPLVNANLAARGAQRCQCCCLWTTQEKKQKVNPGSTNK